jgi:hypothetical protein
MRAGCGSIRSADVLRDGRRRISGTLASSPASGKREPNSLSPVDSYSLGNLFANVELQLPTPSRPRDTPQLQLPRLGALLDGYPHGLTFHPALAVTSMGESSPVARRVFDQGAYGSLFLSAELKSESRRVRR